MKCVWPLPPSPAVNRVDVTFLDPRYPGWRRQMGLSPDEHPGIDLNVAGTSGDNDLGYPVVSILPGVVVHAKKHRVWGNVVMVEHYPYVAEYYGYPKLFSQYAHLAHITVAEGQHVLAGEPVGAIGRGDSTKFRAHLHFELRKKQLAGDYWPGRNRQAILDAYTNPIAFLEKHAQYANRFLLLEGRVFDGTAPGRTVAKPRVVINGPLVNIGF